MSQADIQAEFAQALQSIGLVLEGPPIMDGRKHQAKAYGARAGGKPQANSGIYTGHADGRRTSIGYNNKTGQTVRYSPSGDVPQMSDAERAALVAADREARRAQLEDQRLKDARASEIAQRIWAGADPARPTHRYLVSKDIGPEGLRQGVTGQTAPIGKDGKERPIDGWLIVPLRNIDGELRNLQFIPPGGKPKLFLPASKKGLFFVEGNLIEGQPKQFLEGLATTKSAHRLTLLTSVMAIDTSNLKPVGEAFRAKFPNDAQIYVTDNDHHLPVNAGVKYGQAAAEANRGVAVTPQIPGGKGTDVNDLWVDHGFAAARASMERAYEAQGVRELLPPAPPPPPVRDAREVARAMVKPSQSYRSAARHAAAREAEKPAHQPGV
jgi:putative DNA primase/helicase